MSELPQRLPVGVVSISLEALPAPYRELPRPGSVSEPWNLGQSHGELDFLGDAPCLVQLGCSQALGTTSFVCP